MPVPSTDPSLSRLEFMSVQAKLSSMVGASSGYLDTLPKPVRNRIAFLGALQEEHDALLDQFHLERQALEAKYRALYRELMCGPLRPAAEADARAA